MSNNPSQGWLRNAQVHIQVLIDGMTHPSMQIFMCTNITNPSMKPVVDWWIDAPLCTVFMCTNTKFKLKQYNLKREIELSLIVVFSFIFFSFIVYVLSLMWLMLQCTEQINFFKSNLTSSIAPVYRFPCMQLWLWTIIILLNQQVLHP